MNTCSGSYMVRGLSKMIKKIFKLQLFLIIFCLITSCDLLNLYQDNTQDNEENDIVISTGKIAIQISSHSSRFLDNSVAASLSDTYEVFAYNPDSTVSYNITLTGGSGEFSVPVGTYRVVVLAGKRASFGGSVMLLGTAKVSDVVVVEYESTLVALTLQSISVSMSLPSTAVTNSTYTVTSSYDFKTEGFSFLYGQQIYADPNIVDGESTFDGSIINTVYSCIAPPTAGSKQVYFLGNVIKYTDGVFTCQSGNGTQIGLLNNWAAASGTQLPELDEYLLHTILITATTGLVIEINWG